MRAEEVILQLAKELPRFTDNFNNVISVISIVTGVQNEAIVTTDIAHGLSVGQGVVIKGSESPIIITKIERVLNIATVTTQSDHDVTQGTPTELIIAGSPEPNFNGTKNILSPNGVPNRRTIKIQVDDTGFALAEGGFLLNGSNVFQSYNGVFGVASIISPTVFTYTMGQDALPDAQGTITISSNTRVSGAVSLSAALASYTRQDDKLWAFVVLGDAVASKNRAIESDATDNQQRQGSGADYRQQLIQEMAVYLFVPSANEIAGRKARDLAQSMFRPICRSILFHKFDSNLFVGKFNPLQFSGHGSEAFESGAIYIHQYSFTQVEELYFDDTVGFDDNVAFRDICFEMGVNVGTEQLTACIDLDDEPITLAWILATGFWDDGGMWIDDANWID